MRKILAAWAILLLTAAVGQAALEPGEIAILTTPSPRSRELAEYYAQARGVPKAQILKLDVKPASDLSRAAWDGQVRPAIHAWLREKKLDAKIRCFVTVWDVPLRISAVPKTSPAVVERSENLARLRKTYLERSADLLKTLDGLGAQGKPADRPELDPATTAAKFAPTLDAALKEAQGRFQRLEPAARKNAEAGLEKVFVSGAGLAGLLELVARQQSTGKLPPEVAQHVQHLQTRLETLQQELVPLLTEADTAARDEQILARFAQVRGVLGALRWIEEQQALIEKNETQASFDSELSLIHWSGYPLYRWQGNPLFYAFDRVPNRRPVVMVSRLSAPTPELVKKMIDTSIAVEKTGLEGKVYLDARGMGYDPKRDSLGSYGVSDQSLRDLADRLKKHTKLEVVLDNKPELFQSGQCPEAALYCGWYSLQKYVDAFTWQPGAVGYHIASYEATELTKPGSTEWCPAMLERGVVGTLGPTFEPYLAAFPLPDDFFSVLLTGKYTLAETYYRTAPFLSWAMVLVGDPLYNPFKKQPPLAESALPDRIKAASAEPAAR